MAISHRRGFRGGWGLVALLLFLNVTATLLLALRVKEIGDFLLWFALPKAAEDLRAFEDGGLASPNPPRVAVYYDLTCPLCRESAPALLAARGEFPDSILDWELVPVAPAPFFNNAAYHVGLAFVCAKRQGAEWALLSGALDVEIADVRSIRPLLERAGVVEADFEACLDSQRTRRALWQNRFDAAGKGVRGTPAIVVDGIVVEGVLMEDPLRQLLYTVSGRTPSGG